jgi:hypothetical protein
MVIVFPISGRVEMVLVITVVPQKDICLHGSTYPENADADIIMNKIIPDTHAFLFVVRLNILFRRKCMYIIINIMDTIFLCVIRMVHP